MKRQVHIIEHVDDYLHDVLSADDAAYVEKHVEDCRICQAALEEAGQRLQAIQSLPTVEASEELVRQTMQRVRGTDQRVWRVRKTVAYTWALATAASIAIIGGIHLYYQNLKATSYELQVYGQDKLLADTAGSLRVRLFDRDTQRAMHSIPVDIELLSDKSGNVFRLASFKTDESGSASPRFTLPNAPDGKYELRVRARTPGHDELLTRTIELKRSWKLMLSTDKPVYQPGQTIRMRTLALRRPDLHPVAGEAVVFTVADSKGNIIFKQRNVSSVFGISSADCALAAEIMEGTYTIGCQIAETASQVVVEVKKYVLPKYRIDVKLDRAFYLPGDTVRGTLHADYFFGKPVNGADVEIAVVTTEVAPTEPLRLRVRTDTQGTAGFAYRLPDSLIGKEQDGGDARVTFEFNVRDSAGQEQSRTLSRVVTVNPIRLEVIPEAGRLVNGIKNIVYVFASYPDGRPASVRLAISGVDHEISTSALGVAAFELTPSADKIDLTLRATDGQGQIGRRHVQLDAGRPQRDFLIRTDRAVYRGGDSIQLGVFGAGVEPVFIDFIKDGQTILTETVTMTDGHGERVFDVPPELFGTIEIVAYRFGEAGLPVRKQRVIYIEEARELKIAAELDQSEYRPGESAQLVLRLTDDQDQPTPGAISLAAVDEAVFAVLDQVPGMEQTFFNLDDELLRPIYAIYQWSPHLDTSAFDPKDRIRFEQALFSRTAREPGKREAVFEQLLEEGLINERQLEVLEEPSVNDMIDDASLPDSLVNALRGGDSPHSLAANSYPAKAQQVQRERYQALGSVKVAWFVLVVAVVSTGIVILIMMVPRIWVTVLIVVLGLPLLASIFLPTLSRARELSKSAVARSDLRGIGLGMAVLESEGRLKDVDHTTEKAGDAAPIRVREWFPETLLWRPELITDDQGRVSINVDLADSITTWRLSASAVAGDGRLGGLNTAIKVFQPFFVDLNLPIALTLGDEVSMPVVVYNYLNQAQVVELSLDTHGDWFELLDESTKQVHLSPGEVRNTTFQLRVKRVGQHEIQVTARSSGVGDAIKRAVEVVPGGREVAQVFNGTLSEPREIILDVPTQAIEGSVRAILKIYPSTFSQVLEGLEGVFQRPYGCFEQTSSTTYPNVLALDYLRRTNQAAPDVEATARQYIHLGYQRLLGFEVDGGGFDWFGRPPANRTLTAYGLMEFEDMVRVQDVDQRLIDRTREWLMAQRNVDGSWSPESHKMHIDPTNGGSDARLCTTAYIAWAVFSGAADKSLAAVTQKYLLSHPARSIRDPYVLALVCNALLTIDDDNANVQSYVDHLIEITLTSANGKHVWWQQAADARTTFYGAGLSGDIETTALATMALLKSGRHGAHAQAGLMWLVSQKDRLGTWHSSQATVLALKALLAGTGKPLGSDRERVIEFAVDRSDRRMLRIPADQGEVMQQVALSKELKLGTNTIMLSEPSGTGVGYQLDFRYHVPAGKEAPSDQPLAIDIVYDRNKLHVGDAVTVQATVQNNTPAVAPMVILDLPIPAGFAADVRAFDALADQGSIAKYQLTPRSIVVYLRQLAPGKPLVLNYRLQATMPVRVKAPSARIYEYYDPDRVAISKDADLVIEATDG